MSNEPQAYMATVFFTDVEGADQTIKALVIGADLEDATRTAIEVVSELPHCLQIIGGIVEPATDGQLDYAQKAMAQAMAPEKPSASMSLRAPGATVH
jgi:hypothetical protein